MTGILDGYLRGSQAGQNRATSEFSLMQAEENMRNTRADRTYRDKQRRIASQMRAAAQQRAAAGRQRQANINQIKARSLVSQDGGGGPLGGGGGGNPAAQVGAPVSGPSLSFGSSVPDQGQSGGGGVPDVARGGANQGQSPALSFPTREAAPVPAQRSSGGLQKENWESPEALNDAQSRLLKALADKGYNSEVIKLHAQFSSENVETHKRNTGYLSQISQMGLASIGGPNEEAQFSNSLSIAESVGLISEDMASQIFDKYNNEPNKAEMLTNIYQQLLDYSVDTEEYAKNQRNVENTKTKVGTDADVATTANDREVAATALDVQNDATAASTLAGVNTAATEQDAENARFAADFQALRDADVAARAAETATTQSTQDFEEALKLQNAKPNEPSVRDKKLASQRSLYPNLSEEDIVAIVDGNIEMITDPVTGIETTYNLSTNAPIDYGKPSVSEESTKTQDQESLYKIAPHNTVFGQANGMFGAGPLISEGLSNIFGQFLPSDMVGNESAQKRTLYKALREKFTAAINEDSRLSVDERKVIYGSLPSLGLLQSDESAKASLLQWHDVLVDRLAENEAIASDTTLNEKWRILSQGNSISIRSLLSALGDPASLRGTQGNANTTSSGVTWTVVD